MVTFLGIPKIIVIKSRKQNSEPKYTNRIPALHLGPTVVSN